MIFFRHFKEKKVKRLLTELEQERMWKGNSGYPTDIVVSLSKIGDMQAIDPLITAYLRPRCDDKDYLGARYCSYKDEIKKALIEVTNRIGKKAIERLIARPWGPHDTTLPVLVQLDSDNKTIMITLLVEVLQNHDFNLSKWSAKVLYEIGWRATNTQDEISYLIAAEKWDELVKIGKQSSKYNFPVFKW